MNADDKTPMLTITLAGLVEIEKRQFALGRRAGMTEAAGICNKQSETAIKAQSGDPNSLSNIMLRHHASQAYSCADAIEKARDA